MPIVETITFATGTIKFIKGGVDLIGVTVSTISRIQEYKSHCVNIPKALKPIINCLPLDKDCLTSIALYIERVNFADPNNLKTLEQAIVGYQKEVDELEALCARHLSRNGDTFFLHLHKIRRGPPNEEQITPAQKALETYKSSLTAPSAIGCWVYF